MTIACWTIVHRAATTVTRHVAHAARTVRHIGRPRLATGLHPIRHAVPHPHTWVEVVCRALPALVAGTALVVPTPPSHPPLSSLASSTTTTQSAPVSSPTSLPIGVGGDGWGFGPEILPLAAGVGPVVAPSTGGSVVPSNPSTNAAAPEPSSIAVVLSGLAGLFGLSFASRYRRVRRRTRGAASTAAPHAHRTV